MPMKLETSGLPKESWLKIGHVRAFSTERIGGPIGRTDDETLVLALDGLAEICG